MAKKVRFPLKMDKDAEVYSVEELRENFSVPKVIEYIGNGRMQTWLRDRYENEKAELVEALDLESGDISRKVCEIFDIEYDEEAEAELEKAEERKERLARLHEIISDSSYDEKIDLVAFDQDELYDRLDEGVDTIYLCGEKFTVPIDCRNMRYIGINEPVISVNTKKTVDLSELGIFFDGVKFDENAKAVLQLEESKPLSCGTGAWIPTNTSNPLFNRIAEVLNEVDMDKFAGDNRELKDRLKNVGFIGIY